MTLTQTYSITRVVVAVKTLPPLHLYQFIPSKTLTDISTRLQVRICQLVNEHQLEVEWTSIPKW